LALTEDEITIIMFLFSSFLFFGCGGPAWSGLLRGGGGGVFFGVIKKKRAGPLCCLGTDRQLAFCEDGMKME
jgi:hypothetical protein